MLVRRINNSRAFNVNFSSQVKAKSCITLRAVKQIRLSKLISMLSPTVSARVNKFLVCKFICR